jgi:hypothetical protein
MDIDGDPLVIKRGWEFPYKLGSFFVKIIVPFMGDFPASHVS